MNDICGARPRNNGLFQIQARPRSVLSEEKPRMKHYSIPINAKEACPRSNSSSDITKPRRGTLPSHFSSSSQHIK